MEYIFNTYFPFHIYCIVMALSSSKAMADTFKSVASAIGISSLVGNSLAQILPLPVTPGGPWKVYGIGSCPLPPWINDCQIEYIQCDTTNAAEMQAKLSHLTDMTNIFRVAWTGSSFMALTSRARPMEPCSEMFLLPSSQLLQNSATSASKQEL